MEKPPWVEGLSVLERPDLAVVAAQTCGEGGGLLRSLVALFLR